MAGPILCIAPNANKQILLHRQFSALYRHAGTSTQWREALYDGPKNSDTKRRLNKVVKCHHTAHPFYGSLKFVVALQPDFWVNRKALQRHTPAPHCVPCQRPPVQLWCSAGLREMGIAGITPGLHLSQRREEHRIYPYLLGNLSIRHRNNSVFVIGRVLVYSDSDVSAAYGLAKQIPLTSLSQRYKII